MRQVWKFPIPDIGSVFTLSLPGPVEVVHFDMQRGLVAEALGPPVDSIFAWIEVTPDAPRRTVAFTVVGTGWDIHDGFSHAGTLLAGSWVWHLYMSNIDWVVAKGSS